MFGLEVACETTSVESGSIKSVYLVASVQLESRNGSSSILIQEDNNSGRFRMINDMEISGITEKFYSKSHSTSILIYQMKVAEQFGPIQVTE